MYEPHPYKFFPTEIHELVTLAKALNPQPGPGGSCMTDPISTHGQFFPLLHETFPGYWANCHLVGLWPSQQIVAHADAKILGVRYHIPIQMNDRCWAFAGGKWQQLRLGQVYTLDPTEVHGAVNWGETIRLHLMIDVEPQA